MTAEPATTVRSRLAAFFAVDDPWFRGAEVSRWDVVVGVGTFGLSAVTFEMSRSMGALESIGQPVWLQYLAVALGALLLVGRRRWPLTVAVLAALHMFVVGVTMPAVMGQLALQIVYFVAIFSGVAWSRSRRDMLVVMGGVVLFMFVWLAWTFAIGSGIDSIRESLGEDASRRPGLVSPVAASVVVTAVVNALYFGGAIIGGQVAWRGARQRARLADQARTIGEQSADLQQRAVLGERLRIARELHDVVAHHVSVIGIQAAGARRLLTRDPEAAARALASVEGSSREAVHQMRSLVGALREPTDARGAGAGDPTHRAPEPGLGDLPALVGEVSAPGLRVTYQLVESPEGAAAALPAALGLSLYRIAQEALTNVRRHSTAANASVVLRVERSARTPFVEVEVTDDGRPVPGSSGSGLGLLGVRERAASRRGQVDIGPRVGGGFRVRVRFPLQDVPTGDVVAQDEPASGAAVGGPR
ncbi:sensor histidine kinase [Pedococcus soli]